jgi:hypothetical protein
MTAEDRTGDRRFRRREALTLLAASGGATVAGSLILSQTAFADSGTIPCRYNFTGSPNAAIRVRNRATTNDQIRATVTGVGGTCPCGGAAAIAYSYFFQAPAGTTNTGWITANVTTVPGALFPPSGTSSVTVSVGIRATCNSPSGTTIRCRFASQTFTVPAPNSTTTFNLALSANNGTSAPPVGMPACNPGAIAPDQGLQGGSLQVVVGYVADDGDVIDGPVVELSGTTGQSAPLDPSPVDRGPDESPPSTPSPGLTSTP